ncbi:hypothetical protein KIH74_07280 [Kineosporia sp. J2-2]|uniref:Uncharacterized protein n=1 Tax=Kineosporia corallincola TaxID=2835133 RepID=A0ABS5TCB6_9ACTN|nr:DUF6518 family protein [Kineosporia corallincola]MBT0768722.1 hypothetical protein [Kineosporia corallincola]
MSFTTDHRPVLEVRGTDREAAAATGVALAAFLIGVLTAFAQGFLPGTINSLANSASGWTLFSVLLIWSVRVRPGLSALLGAASFLLLTIGYTAASAVRGHTYDPTLFGVVGLVVGPFVGLAAVWVRGRDVRAALATAALSGIAVGEAVYGLTVVRDSTSPVYWVLAGAAGLALLGYMTLRRLRESVTITLALGCSAVVAAGFLIAFQSLGSIG